MKVFSVSWNKFDSWNYLFAIVLIAFTMTVHQCSGNDYDTHSSTADRAEEMFR